MDTTRTDNDVQTYNGDYYGWTQQQAGYLRSGRMDRVDLENVAEEIDSLGKSQLHALTSSYRLIAMHLLKFLVQPQKASASWLTTIGRERGNIELMLDDSPGLKSRREERFAKAYDVARRAPAAAPPVPRGAVPAARGLTGPTTVRCERRGSAGLLASSGASPAHKRTAKRLNASGISPGSPHRGDHP